MVMAIKSATTRAGGIAPALAQDQQLLPCNETDALLQVKYTITKDEWDSSRPIFDKPFLYLQGNELRYKNFAKLKDYEACLPRHECSEVVVGGLPTDAYEISFDGKAVNITHEFVFDGKNPVTSTKVGTCTKPICKDTEALLEIQYWSGYYNYNQHSFRVEDKEGNTVLHGEPEGRYSVNQTWRASAGSRNPPPTFSVIFDGKLVRRSDSWLFDSVRFGGSCKPRCNEEDESVIEFFMHDTDSRYSKVEYEYEWDLNVTHRNSPATVSSGVVPQGPSISPLHHKIMCVPKDSCSSFYISAPNVTREVVRREPSSNTTDWNNIIWVNVTTNETLFLSPVYTLAMDNVTYRKVQWVGPEHVHLGLITKLPTWEVARLEAYAMSKLKICLILNCARQQNMSGSAGILVIRKTSRRGNFSTSFKATTITIAVTISTQTMVWSN
eukprot:scaffold24187_cov156-Skeletonema_dohrnii-CCMP3373.AAC.5